MTDNEETRSSGQAACDCLGCRIRDAVEAVLPKELSDHDRALTLGALIKLIAEQLAKHPDFPGALNALTPNLMAQIIAAKFGSQTAANDTRH